jgi:hypothetical protein
VVLVGCSQPPEPKSPEYYPYQSAARRDALAAQFEPYCNAHTAQAGGTAEYKPCAAMIVYYDQNRRQTRTGLLVGIQYRGNRQHVIWSPAQQDSMDDTSLGSPENPGQVLQLETLTSSAGTALLRAFERNRSAIAARTK